MNSFGLGVPVPRTSLSLQHWAIQPCDQLFSSSMDRIHRRATLDLLKAWQAGWIVGGPWELPHGQNNGAIPRQANALFCRGLLPASQISKLATKSWKFEIYFMGYNLHKQPSLNCPGSVAICLSRLIFVLAPSWLDADWRHEYFGKKKVKVQSQCKSLVKVALIVTIVFWVVSSLSFWPVRKFCKNITVTVTKVKQILYSVRYILLVRICLILMAPNLAYAALSVMVGSCRSRIFSF